MHVLKKEPMKDTELCAVYLTDILVSHKYHSRENLKEHIVRRYENIYRAYMSPDSLDADVDDFDDFKASRPDTLKPLECDTHEAEPTSLPTIPPLDVALINDVLVLYDGFHRYEALKRIGALTVDVKVHHGKTYIELPFLAARTNLTHGLPMTNRDVRKIVFKSYIKSKHNMIGRSYKSYRDIAYDFASMYSHNTFRNWMRKDFPSVFEAMSSEDEAAIDFEPLNPDDAHLRAIEDALSTVSKFHASIKSSETKNAAITATEKTLRLLRENNPKDYKQYAKDNATMEF